MTIPQRVVGHDKTTLSEHRESHLVGFNIRSLVAINENEVEGDAQTWSLGDGIANDKVYFVGHGAARYPRTSEIFLLVVNLEGVQKSVVWQSLGQANGTISAERAHFEHAFGLRHLHKHLQQTALQMPASHTSVQRMQVGGSVKSIQVVAFGVYVVDYIGGLVHALVFEALYCQAVTV